jgi:PAS domain-containing protein
MTFETDGVRRWTRVLTALRTRRLKLGLDSDALEALLGESLDVCASLLQDLASAQLLCDQLRRAAHDEGVQRQYVLDQMPTACVSTDERGVIQQANRPAAELLNVSAKHLRGRMLLHFAADRGAFVRLLQQLPITGDRLEAFVPVRPRERGLFKLKALIVPAATDDEPSWLWFLAPAATAVDATAQWRHAYSERDTA